LCVVLFIPEEGDVLLQSTFWNTDRSINDDGVFKFVNREKRDSGYDISLSSYVGKTV
jgi:hypothetical protein